MRRSEREGGKGHLGLILALYLLGIFMGALDTGIVTPARTVIQTALGVDARYGVWMITIYTLAYAVSIPIMGKLADKNGRKYVYLASIFLFGLGSLFCGLAQDIASFEVLLVARAVQAFGAGGILPVATAEFGTTFPAEKRGMALGLVGGVYGIANIFGASAGSAILDIFGTQNWQFIFYVNIPIVIFILAAGFVVLPNTVERDVKPVDVWGIAVLTAMTLSLLYGLKNIDFFDLAATVTSTDVYPFLIAFVVLVPLFVLAERRAQDPVIDLDYFTNPSILVTLFLSIVTGFVMMGMIFIPQFAENALKLSSGSGGYFVMILALFAGVGAPVSGKLIDRFGVKAVLGFGLVASIAGSLFLVFVAAVNPGLVSVVVSLVLIGLGMGFTMGTPLNYMMLEKTDDSQSNSALATLSLVRSIGTAVAPAIMVGFLAHAGVAVQSDVMAELPAEVSVPAIAIPQELMSQMQQVPMAGTDGAPMAGMGDLTSARTIKLDMGSGDSQELSPELVRLMQDSDVTTIVDSTKVLASAMFTGMRPQIEAGMEAGLDQAAAGMKAAAPGVAGVDEMMAAVKAGVPAALDGAEAGYLEEIEGRRAPIEEAFQRGLGEGFQQLFSLVALMSAIGLGSLFFYKEERRLSGRPTEPATS